MFIWGYFMKMSPDSFKFEFNFRLFCNLLQDDYDDCYCITFKVLTVLFSAP